MKEVRRQNVGRQSVALMRGWVESEYDHASISGGRLPPWGAGLKGDKQRGAIYKVAHMRGWVETDAPLLQRPRHGCPHVGLG